MHSTPDTSTHRQAPGKHLDACANSDAYLYRPKHTDAESGRHAQAHSHSFTQKSSSPHVPNTDTQSGLQTQLPWAATYRWAQPDTTAGRDGKIDT